MYVFARVGEVTHHWTHPISYCSAAMHHRTASVLHCIIYCYTLHTMLLPNYTPQHSSPVYYLDKTLDSVNTVVYVAYINQTGALICLYFLIEILIDYGNLNLFSSFICVLL